MLTTTDSTSPSSAVAEPPAPLARPRAEQRLYELWAELRDLQAAAALLEWDQETQMPAAANAARGDVLATLAALEHRVLICDELLEVTEECAAVAEEGSVLEAQARVAREAIDHARKIPERLQRELATARSEALGAWQEAKASADFAIFEKPLGRFVDLCREKAAALAEDGRLYDALIDQFERGARVEDLAPLFDDLEAQLAPLVRAVAKSGVEVDESPAKGDFPAAAQAAFSGRLSAAFGFDYNAGRLDASPHPFCIGIHHRDVRLTYRVEQGDFRSCLFGVLHETGHGLYEQGLPAEWRRTPIDEAASVGLHESQSLLWENHVGRSRGFWRFALPIYRQHFPAAPEATVEDLWRTFHTVRPSLIRVDADQATYNLHIAVRFELERALFAERPELEVADLPGAWNELYEKYLGVCPANDAEGVLQDIHWAHGIFGYFPTYALGTVASAQLIAAARRDLGDLETSFAAGEFAPLLGWLRERIHSQGRRHTAAELIERATGRPLAADDLLTHLRTHAAEVYGV